MEEDEKKVRDLSQTIVKLNGIIKTGQDALSQEQELVCKLKQQLADKVGIIFIFFFLLCVSISLY